MSTPTNTAASFQPVGYLVTEGHVLACRDTEVPARPPEAFTRADGTEGQTRPTVAQHFREVLVSVPASIGGEARDGLTSHLVVRCPLERAAPDVGVGVRWAVHPRIISAWMGTRTRQWIVYELLGDAPAVAADAPRRLASAASG